MQTKSRLPILAYISSIMSPYGIATISTAIFTANRYWFFPFWTYVHDFNKWLGYGFIIPPFSPSFSPLLSILGVLWCMLGLYVSKALHQFYTGQRDAKSVLGLTINLLILQSIATIIIGFLEWETWNILVIPLPVHVLIVLFLLWLRIHGMKIGHLNDNRV